MELPNNAAVRIVLNPHSLPQIPASLSDLVTQNRRREIICELQQTNYTRRKQRWDIERLSRISASQSAIDSDSDDEPMPAAHTIRRNSSVIEYTYRRRLPLKEELVPKGRQNSH